NAGGGTLSGTLTRSTSQGVSTFNDLAIIAAGTGYTLTASAGALQATSAAFNMAAFGAATKLSFVAPPSNADVAAVMSPAVQVAVLDALGNTVTSSSAAVTLAYGANPGAGTLGGTLTVQAVAGIATFVDLTGTAAGNNFTLTATATSLSSATS